MNKIITLVFAALFLFFTSSASAEDAPSPGEEKLTKEQKKQREEVQKKIDAAMEQVFSPANLSNAISQALAEQEAETNVKLSMSAEELRAIKPLLATVKALKMQKDLIDTSDRTQKAFGGNGKLNPYQSLLGNVPLAPSLVDYQAAFIALRAVLNDAQATDTDVMNAIARLRKADGQFAIVLEKAENDLRAVLNPKQEAILIEEDILE